ncbi:MAG: SIMPL domain-containing protein [Ilumatobacter sp.]|uniref:SIMPL domain-containing protein n=1 Tax=Ilumatobacter sp. TaxID=1967498 RepID=UPI003299D67A
MTQMEITVRGSHSVYAPPQRATASLQVAIDGPTSDEVFAGVNRTAAAVRESLEPLHRPDTGPVTWWSSDQIRTWANRPYHDEGVQLPLVHHARLGFQVKFSEFVEMGRWISGVAALPGASITGIEWALTADHRTLLVAQVRAAAVRDAESKAKEYAAALGVTTVRAIAIADAGMLGEGLHPVTASGASFARMKSSDNGGVEFAPQDVAVSADIDARFLAG